MMLRDIRQNDESTSSEGTNESRNWKVDLAMRYAERREITKSVNTKGVRVGEIRRVFRKGGHLKGERTLFVRNCIKKSGARNGLISSKWFYKMV